MTILTCHRQTET